MIASSNDLIMDSIEWSVLLANNNVEVRLVDRPKDDAIFVNLNSSLPVTRIKVMKPGLASRKENHGSNLDVLS